MRPLDRWVWPAFRLGSVVNLGCRSSFDRLRMSFLVLRMILRQAQDERGLLDSCLRRNDGWLGCRSSFDRLRMNGGVAGFPHLRGWKNYSPVISGHFR